jgi:hypothetical protein
MALHYSVYVCRYLKTCDVDVRDPDTSDKLGDGSKAYASGKIDRRTNKRVHGTTIKVNNMYLSSHQMLERDRLVDVERAVIERRIGEITRAKAESLLQELYKQHGSKGSSEHVLSALPYWDVKMHHPYAVYHLLYLGVAKDFLHWLLVRLGAGDKPDGVIACPFDRPRDLGRLIQARRGHFVLRDKPDCIMVDFVKLSGKMIASEFQLVYEVGVPYYCHDLEAFGLPPIVNAMWLLLRHGMIIMTRVPEVEDYKAYKDLLLEGRAALYAYATIAEYIHTTVENGLNQFSFTWKLHVAVCHLAHTMLESGHGVQGNEWWIERYLRHKASTCIKCAPSPLFYLHLCLLAAFTGGV